MNTYELVIIINANLKNGIIQEINNKVQNKINNYAKITKIEEKGIRKLAYEIKKNKEGYYIIYQFETEKCKENNAILEIERYCRITDEIIKFLTVKL